MKTAIVVLLFAIACLASAAPDLPVNSEFAKRALVVMRAKRVSELPVVDTYRWYEVEVLTVFENRAEQIFLNAPIKVAALKSNEGIPAGISTLYLNRYSKSDKDLWILVDGSPAKGVSHISN